MTPDETAVVTLLATQRRGLTVTGIATHLGWFRSSAIREYKKNPDEYRAYRVLKRMLEQGKVFQTMTGAGSRYKLSGQAALSQRP